MPHDLAVLALGMRRPSGAEAAINLCEAETESQVTREAEKPLHV